MKFVSTRGGVRPVGIREALETGLASDGGLFIPERFPRFKMSDISELKLISEFAEKILAPFFTEDDLLSRALPEICRKAFNFPIPLTSVPGRPGDFILELYHGPTSAFKDVGARFLANCMEALNSGAEAVKPRTVIVATSGDTGGAVAGAFYHKPAIEVVILFPKGKISPRQEKQLCAWGGNIHAFAVDGVFDDCQKIAKEALLDTQIKRSFLSANSINLGRIFPQMIYYAYAAVMLHQSSQGPKDLPRVIIPSGNLGNSLAALWCKQLGFPLGEIHLALNANHGVADFIKTGTWVSHKTIPTLANAMDVSVPSNLERVRTLFPDADVLRKNVWADSVSDEEIKSEIQNSEGEWGQVLCPHTATAAVVRKRLPSTGRSILVSTAHPAKFETIVEPLLGRTLEIPKALQEILKRPTTVTEIDASYTAFKKALEKL